MNDNNNNAKSIKSPLGDLGVFVASPSDLPDILAIQKNAFLSEAELYQNFNIEPLTQTLSELEELPLWVELKRW